MSPGCCFGTFDSGRAFSSYAGKNNVLNKVNATTCIFAWRPPYARDA